MVDQFCQTKKKRADVHPFSELEIRLSTVNDPWFGDVEITEHWEISKPDSREHKRNFQGALEATFA